ncbi:MAG: lipoate--protein ligase [Bacillota bacterium]
MLYIRNDSTSPYFNHAVEEYFIKNTDEECFILWRNIPCILIGKNQNAMSEINIEYVKENNIPIVRRLSGGGAVFNDLGNINFTFITNKDSNDSIDFKKFAQPIINALVDLNVKAEFSGRNDITIDGKKFSGNAQYSYKNRVLHHGTLLFSGNLTDLSAALKTKPLKFEDKSVKSVASRVTNISAHLDKPMDVLEFREFLKNHVMKANQIKAVHELSEQELAEINKIAKERFESWEWNFGSSPKYSYTNEKRFAGGTVEFNMEVERGIIEEIRIYGDFFGEKDVKELEAALKGVRHTEEDIRKALSSYEIGKYLANITIDDIISGLF